MQKEETVFPGTFLAYEEEFMAGKNAYEDDEGNVYSTSVGIKEFDSENHEVLVKNSPKEVSVIKRGDIVIARVTSVKRKSVLVEIISGGEKNELVFSNSMAALPIFNIMNGFVKEASDFYKAGDIIKARVFQVFPYGIDLETKDPELGVIKAFGVKSRTPLVLINGKLRDTVTGATEERKISTNYILR